MLSQPQGHSATGRIMSMKNSSNKIGSWNRNLPTCRTLPQPTAPPHSPSQDLLDLESYVSRFLITFTTHLTRCNYRSSLNVIKQYTKLWASSINSYMSWWLMTTVFAVSFAVFSLLHSFFQNNLCWLYAADTAGIRRNLQVKDYKINIRSCFSTLWCLNF
jgi:hypothetical protein